MSAESTLTAEVVAEAPAGGLSGLGININIFAAQLVNVLVIFFVLRKWAFKPLVDRLEERRLRVEKSEADAKEADRRLVQSVQEGDRLRVEGERAAQAIREAAIADGERLAHETTDRARAQVEDMVLQGKATLIRDHEQMMREARADMAKLAVAGATAILKEGVDRKMAEKLAAEAIERISV